MLDPIRLRRTILLLALLIASAPGCRSGPRNFLGVNDPAPLNRARAAGMDRPVPDVVAVPELLRRLDDEDAVVRLSAHEALRRRTGQDFGYQPWADPAEREPAAARWHQWWAARSGQAVRPSPQAGLAAPR
jgi:hypothetical protein